MKGWTETPVDVLRSEAGVELHLVVALKDEHFQPFSFDINSFGALPVHASL